MPRTGQKENVYIRFSRSSKPKVVSKTGRILNSGLQVTGKLKQLASGYKAARATTLQGTVMYVKERNDRQPVARLIAISDPTAIKRPYSRARR